MSTNAPNRIAELRKLRNMTQQQLADALGAHWITISKLERGKLPLTFSWAERIGKALGVGEYEAFNKKINKSVIFVDGTITDGGKAYYYHDEEGDEDFEAYHVDVDLTRYVGSHWFVIDNDGFFPFFQSGDLVQVAWQSREDTDKFLNRLCLASIKTKKDGKYDNVLGFIVRGRNLGTYDLNILSGAPMRDIDLDAVAAVTMALFNATAWEMKGKNEKLVPPENLAQAAKYD